MATQTLDEITTLSYNASSILSSADNAKMFDELIATNIDYQFEQRVINGEFDDLIAQALVSEDVEI